MKTSKTSLSRFSPRIAVALSVAAIVMVVGCYSTKYGKQIDQSKVQEITKGATTRAEIEQLFGSPMSVSMLGDGRRMMIYYYTQTSTKTSPAAYIPGVNLIAMGTGKTGSGTSATETLQIMLNTNDVVEDYEFSNATNNFR